LSSVLVARFARLHKVSMFVLFEIHFWTFLCFGIGAVAEHVFSACFLLRRFLLSFPAIPACRVKFLCLGIDCVMFLFRSAARTFLRSRSFAQEVIPTLIISLIGQGQTKSDWMMLINMQDTIQAEDALYAHKMIKVWETIIGADSEGREILSRRHGGIRSMPLMVSRPHSV